MRLAHWPEALTALIDARRAMPFSWGASDCCLFAADAALAMTGIYYAAGWRGQYDDMKGARRLMRRDGGLAAMVDSLGLAHVAPVFAQRGDIVLLDIDGDALAIHLGRNLVAQGLAGLVFRPIADAAVVWRLP